MTKLILSYKAILAIFFLTSIIGVFYTAKYEETTQEWQGIPVFSKWIEKADATCMEVVCDEKTGYIKDPKLIINYILNQNQPLPKAILYKDGRVEAIKNPDQTSLLN